MMDETTTPTVVRLAGRASLGDCVVGVLRAQTGPDDGLPFAVLEFSGRGSVERAVVRPGEAISYAGAVIEAVEILPHGAEARGAVALRRV